MELSLVSKCMTQIIKFLPTIQFLLQKVGDQKMNGTWCTCWQNKEGSNEFQLGSIDIKQLFNACSGYFYSGAHRWPFKAEYKDGKFEGVYYTSDNHRGHFKLRFSDDGHNFHQMLGKWTGILENKETGVIEQGPWLKLCFANGNCFKTGCCKKEFDENVGSCTKK